MSVKFKYHDNPLKSKVFKQGAKQVCQCCNDTIDTWYTGPFYSIKDITCLCEDCICSGKAAETFNGSFIGSADYIDNFNKYVELIYKNPGIYSYQDLKWPSHCNDYCKFINYVTWEDLIKLKIDKSIIYNKDKNGFSLETLKENITKNGYIKGYLFQCLSCKKYILLADCS